MLEWNGWGMEGAKDEINQMLSKMVCGRYNMGGKTAEEKICISDGDSLSFHRDFITHPDYLQHL